MPTASTVEPADLVPFIEDGTGRPAAEMPIRELWHWRVERTPQRPWLHYEDRVWTYEKCDVEARSLAGGLHGLLPLHQLHPLCALGRHLLKLLLIDESSQCSQCSRRSLPALLRLRW